MTHAGKGKRFQFDFENLQLVTIDVDGVLINGKLKYSNNNHENLELDTKNGISVKLF